MLSLSVSCWEAMIAPIGEYLVSFTNHIGTAFLPYPDFVNTASINIHPVPCREGGLRGVLVLGVRDCKFAVNDQMRRQAAVGMRSIMGIASRYACMSALRFPHMHVHAMRLYIICAVVRGSWRRGLWRGS